MYYKDGDEWFKTHAARPVGKYIKDNALTEQEAEDLKSEIIRQFDLKTGNKTTDLKTFEFVIIVAYKE